MRSTKNTTCSCAETCRRTHSPGLRISPAIAPSSRLEDNSKGIAAGETWSITPHIVNDVRYGLIRQGFSNRGTSQGDYTTFRFLNDASSDPYYITRSSVVNVPVNNLVDNLTWTKGSHTLGFGGNWRLIHNNRGSDANSFNSATTQPLLVQRGSPRSGDTGGTIRLRWLCQFLPDCLCQPGRRDPPINHRFQLQRRQGRCDGEPLSRWDLHQSAFQGK